MVESQPWMRSSFPLQKVSRNARLTILPVPVLGSAVFFKAEDGIRYWSVTGVQTCALRSSTMDASTRRSPQWPAAGLMSWNLVGTGARLAASNRGGGTLAEGCASADRAQGTNRTSSTQQIFHVILQCL